MPIERLPLDENQKQIARDLGLSDDFMRILAMRGLSSEQEIISFLRPSFDKMSSPFDIDGMKEASDRIKLAIQRKEKVLIFGDYDCDGIGAISILMLYLRDKLDIKYFIPNRVTDGYGMNVDTLKSIISRRRPNLVITVDCGITAYEEVEYLKSEGIDVIVTDHHEPQEVLPDCIIVDPKVKRTGFYDFCGAGVALKVVEALAGREEIKKYLDVAAISTIADVVPLKDDNRIIAYYGLKQIATSPRKGIKTLLGTEKVTSHDVMFKLAPRINAAGRLGSAMKTVDLFLEDDIFLLRNLCDELESDNARRQAICETVVTEAKAMIHGTDFNKTGIIVLAGEDWEAGVLGIAAARIVEEFKFPAILFTKSGDSYKGSARSIKEVNLFEELSKFSHLFTAFGGHSQAAGVTLPISNFDEFKENINKEIMSKVDRGTFLPTFDYDMELDASTNLLPFAKELTLLEPTGYGNPEPSFLIRGDFRFDRIGVSKHVKCSLKGVDLVGFGKYEYSLGSTRGERELNVSLGVNVYQNRQYAQGIIRTFKANGVSMSEEDSTLINLHQLNYTGEATLDEIAVEDIEKHLEKPFGTLIVCFSEEEYNALISKSERMASLPMLVANARMLSPVNSVIVCPAVGFDYSYYERVIFAGKPLSSGYIAHIKSLLGEVYTIGDCTPQRIEIDQNAFRIAFMELRRMAQMKERLVDYKRLLQALTPKTKINFVQLRIILDVFKDLGIVAIGDKGVITVSNQKTDLEKSAIYRNVRK